MERNTERTLLYLDNGEECLQDNFTYSQAKIVLKRQGYKVAYSGRKLTKFGIRVLVGINAKNAVGLHERRQNGLYRATEIKIN